MKASLLGLLFATMIPLSTFASEYYNRPQVLKITFLKEVSVKGTDGRVFVLWPIDKNGKSCETNACDGIPCGLLSETGNPISIKKGTVLKGYAAFSDWEYSYVSSGNQAHEVEFNCGPSASVNLKQINAFYKGLMKIEVIR